MDIGFVSHLYSAAARALVFSFFSAFLPFIGRVALQTGQVQGGTRGRGHSARNVNLRGSTVTSALGGWGEGRGRGSKLLAGENLRANPSSEVVGTLWPWGPSTPFPNRSRLRTTCQSARKYRPAPTPDSRLRLGGRRNYRELLSSFGPGRPRGRLPETSDRHDGETKASSRPGRRLGLARRPAGRAERSQGPGRESARPAAPQVKRRAARPAAARERPLSHILRLRTVDAWSQPQVGAAGCAAPRPRAGRERRNPTSVCTMRSRAHSCRHRGKKGREEGETLSQAMTVCGGLFRVSFSGDPGALLPGPLSRRFPIVPALRTAGDGGPRQQSGPSSPTPLLPAPGGPAEAPKLLGGQSRPSPPQAPGALPPDLPRAEAPSRPQKRLNPPPGAQGTRACEGLVSGSSVPRAPSSDLSRELLVFGASLMA